MREQRHKSLIVYLTQSIIGIGISAVCLVIFSTIWQVAFSWGQVTITFAQGVVQAVIALILYRELEQRLPYPLRFALHLLLSFGAALLMVVLNGWLPGPTVLQSIPVFFIVWLVIFIPVFLGFHISNRQTTRRINALLQSSRQGQTIAGNQPHTDSLSTDGSQA